MEKTTLNYTLKTNEDMELIKKELEKVTVRLVVIYLALFLTPLLLGIVCKVFFVVDPIGKLFSTIQGKVISFVVVMILLKIFSSFKIRKQYSGLKQMAIGIKKYEEMLTKLDQTIEKKDSSTAQDILDDLEDEEVKELFGKLEEYQQAITKAKEFLATRKQI